ncbi:MAG: UDP-3-O-(3-hydroxymyristoyl)glucosamine N-acyltransferase [Candidatus Xenobium sp.]|jgi:UDP-3-O-[3-hydroxymyristoyl] glucosamine N-acyltransferase|nr:UDP-3-O-(3-hydroxymyristoyl)glucosamine N-acyltransferase [Burkholderiales bacterium]
MTEELLPVKIHPSAVFMPGVTLEAEVEVGPGAVLEEGAWIGAGARVGACAYVGPGVRVGPGCILEPGVVLLPGTMLGRGVRVQAGAVLGTDGFGYVLDQGRHRKIPQVGRVEVGDRAVIGPGACVDRATTGVTRIGQDAVLGSMVMVGHNCRVGARSRMGDQSGLAGSSAIGEDCHLGIQTGMAMRAELGDRCQMADRAGALRRFPPDQDLAGFPARPRAEVSRMEAALHRLPALLQSLEGRRT